MIHIIVKFMIFIATTNSHVSKMDLIKYENNIDITNKSPAHLHLKGKALPKLHKPF